MNLSKKFRLAGGIGAICLAGIASAESMFGLTTTGSLVQFDSATPGTFTATANLSGLVNGHTCRGIDANPLNGLLYGISTINSSSVGEAAVYTINPTTGAATQVGATFGFLTGIPRVSMDFNPTTGGLHIISAGTTAAPGLNFLFNTSSGNVTTLPSHGSTFLTGLAFSNNVSGATSTTGYAYNYDLDETGTFDTATGTWTSIGGNGLSTFTNTGSQGFDVSGSTGIAYMNVDVDPSIIDDFFSVNLSTGAFNKLGSFTVTMEDITAAPASAVPEPATLLALGLGAAFLRRRRSSK
jgi:hypothetical protein